MRSRRRSAVIAAAFIAGMATSYGVQAQQQTSERNAKGAIFDVALTGVVFETGDMEPGRERFRLSWRAHPVHSRHKFHQWPPQRNPTAAKRFGLPRRVDSRHKAALYRCRPLWATAADLCGAPPMIGQTTLDLGTILVAQGFAFAAADATGRPVNLAYALAELDAKAHLVGVMGFA